MKHTPFWLVCGKEETMIMKYIVSSKHIVLVMCMMKDYVLQTRLDELNKLEEDRFMDGFH